MPTQLDQTANNPIESFSMESDITFKVKAYYSKETALSETIKEFGPQIKKNLDLFKHELKKRNLDYLTEKNIDDAQSEFYEDRVYIPVIERNIHYEFKTLNGVLCRIEYDIYPMGTYSERRTTYLISNITALYYLKNGIGLKGYTILKNKFFMFRKIGDQTPPAVLGGTESALQTLEMMSPVQNTNGQITEDTSTQNQPPNQNNPIKRAYTGSMRTAQLRAQKAATTRRLRRIGLLGMGHTNPVYES